MLQQSAIIVTEEGVHRGRAGKTDPDGHVDGCNGRRTAGTQDGEDPNETEGVKKKTRRTDMAWIWNRK